VGIVAAVRRVSGRGASGVTISVYS
jgi:hypothetical protein